MVALLKNVEQKQSERNSFHYSWLHSALEWLSARVRRLWHCSQRAGWFYPMSVEGLGEESCGRARAVLGAAKAVISHLLGSAVWHLATRCLQHISLLQYRVWETPARRCRVCAHVDTRTCPQVWLLTACSLLTTCSVDLELEFPTRR